VSHKLVFLLAVIIGRVRGALAWTFLAAKRIELFDTLAAQFCLSLIQLHDEQLGCADLESGILKLLNILESGTTARDKFPSPLSYSQQRATTLSPCTQSAMA
jgi:hypothetical protein